MIRTGEFTLTGFALEWFYPSVSSLVSLQLIRTGEPSSAVLEITLVWLLTCVLPAVHLQVGEFEVTLVAPGVRTHEGTLLVGFCVRSDDGGSHTWDSPNILKASVDPVRVYSVLRAAAVQHRGIVVVGLVSRCVAVVGGS